AATHRDLSQLVAAGRFREDLYYRLRVVTLHVPPLRERPEDIPVLARHFLARFAERFGTGPIAARPPLFAALAARPWPGNVRELENALESLVALSHQDELDLALLGEVPAGAATDARATGDEADAPGAPKLTLKQRVEGYERGLIVAALDAA